MLFNRSHSAAQSVAIGAFIAGAIGVSIGMLFAPKKGRKLRRDISDAAQDILSTVGGFLTKAKTSGEEIIDGMMGTSEVS